MKKPKLSKEKKRLEELRKELRRETLSYGEIAELQSLAPHIEPGDTELLEAAGVPEMESQDKKEETGRMKNMMESIYTYGDGKVDKNDKYLIPYLKELGPKLFNKAFKNYLKELQKFEIVPNVHTDSEGLTYNSLRIRQGKK